MKNPTVDRAMTSTVRKNFIPDQHKSQANLNIALPIGFGQTISQPFTVRLMLNWLDVKPGNKVLDIGTGSGWTYAILSKLVAPGGSVFGVERIANLVEFGRDNCKRAGVKNIKIYKAGNMVGLSQYAPYDRILVSASAKKLPVELLKQLNNGGKLVIPVGNDILEIKKNNDGTVRYMKHPGFVFVPLITD